ncbi:MAG: hypothetical protein JWM50_2136 [Microbacteriaceae bacterium]|jgi:hypothetical protein|nr:hypothetical protein [Microbacteriaceae bacterium]
MMKLEYAGGELLLSNEASHALLRYAEALALQSSSDTVAIPVVTVDGVPGTAEILIGPASQLLALPAAEDFEIDDSEAIDMLRAKFAAIQPSRAIAAEPGSASATADDFEIGWP